MRARRCFAVCAVGAAAVGLMGCDDPAIQLTYRPAVRSTETYELRVDTSTKTQLEEQAGTSRTDSFVLRSKQTVKSAREGSDTRVEVVLTGDGQQPRTYVVRLDRAGQLATVESVEGIPAASLGNLGISELLPSAAGALPRRSLRPGDRWSISQLLRIGEEPAGRLVGRGRLTSLGVSDGVEQAVVDTEVALPVDRTTTGETGETIRLVGSVRTVMKVTQRVTDGVVIKAKARSVGEYDITINPPTIDGGAPVRGSLRVTVTSSTRAL